jgi:hypothetical protein
MQPSDQQVVSALFSPMMQATEKLYKRYSDDELRLVADYLTRMSLLLRKLIPGLQRNGPGEGDGKAGGKKKSRGQRSTLADRRRERETYAHS